MANNHPFTVFISLNENKNPSIDGQTYPVIETIPVVDRIFIPGKKKDDLGENVLIVYQPGNRSIYTDKTIDEIKKERAFSSEPITMLDGQLFIDNRETLLLEYLKVSNYNIACKNRMPDKLPIFRERDKEQEAEEYLEEGKKIFDIQNKILNLYDPDELAALAIVLGDTIADTKKVNEVRRDLLVYLKNQPDKMIEAMENSDNARKVYIIRAFKQNIVQYIPQTNRINWVDGGRICDVPMNQDPENFLLYITGQPGYEELLNNIKMMLPKPTEYVKVGDEKKPPPPQTDDDTPEQPPAKKEAVEPVPVSQENIEDPASDPPFNAEEYVKRAVNCGALEKKGVWFCLKDSVKGDKYFSISNSNAGIQKAVSEDKELKTLLDSEIFSEEESQ